MREKQPLIEVDAVLLHETENAMQLEVSDLGTDWFPKSICEWDVYDGVLRAPRWILDKKFPEIIWE